MSLADEVLSGWAPIVRSVALVTGTRGSFEVTLDGELVFSKSALKRHAGAGEVRDLVEKRLGPPLEWRPQP